MIELDPTQFYKVRPLFEPLMNYQIFCTGVLTGLYQGRVFVDNADDPQTGFVSKDGIWWFLAGKAFNQDFNQALHTALFDKTITGEKGWGGMLVCHPQLWDAEIPALYAPHIPIKTDRLHYVARKLTFDWKALILPDIEIRFVDSSLETDEIQNLGMVEKILNLRKAANNPDAAALGFVAVHDKKIVAYATIDCIVNYAGDIGIYTDGSFRRRGLALILSAALIEYALAHGLTVVHWNCEAFNQGSIRTAEKLGLTLAYEHTMYNLILNPVIHEVNRAWAHFDAGRYPEAIALCNQHIENQEIPAHPHFYYIVARSQMALGDEAEALRFLDMAAQSGWDSAGEAQSDFPMLAGNLTWKAILEKMERNENKTLQ